MNKVILPVNKAMRVVRDVRSVLQGKVPQRLWNKGVARTGFNIMKKFYIK